MHSESENCRILIPCNDINFSPRSSLTIALTRAPFIPTCANRIYIGSFDHTAIFVRLPASRDCFNFNDTIPHFGNSLTQKSLFDKLRMCSGNKNLLCPLRLPSLPEYIP